MAVAQTTSQPNPQQAFDETKVYRLLDKWNFTRGQLIDLSSYAVAVDRRIKTYDHDMKQLVEKNASDLNAARPLMAKNQALPKGLSDRINDIQRRAEALKQARDNDVEQLVQRAAKALRPEQTQSIWYTGQRQRDAEKAINEIRNMSPQDWNRFTERYVQRQLGRQMRTLRNEWNRSQPGTNRFDRRRDQRQWRDDMNPMIDQARQQAATQINQIRDLAFKNPQAAAVQLAQTETNEQDISQDIVAALRELLTSPGASTAIASRAASANPPRTAG